MMVVKFLTAQYNTNTIVYTFWQTFIIIFASGKDACNNEKYLRPKNYLQKHQGNLQNDDEDQNFLL